MACVICLLYLPSVICGMGEAGTEGAHRAAARKSNVGQNPNARQPRSAPMVAQCIRMLLIHTSFSFATLRQP